jgi:hypothetical protein
MAVERSLMQVLDTRRVNEEDLMIGHGSHAKDSVPSGLRLA